MKEPMNFQPHMHILFFIKTFAKGFWHTVHFHYLPHILCRFGIALRCCCWKGLKRAGWLNEWPGAATIHNVVPWKGTTGSADGHRVGD